MSTQQAVLDYLDRIQHGVNMTTLIQDLPDHAPEALKVATKQLYEDRAINRISARGANDRFYYVFYSLYIRTVNVYHNEPDQEPAPAPQQAVELMEAATPTITQEQHDALVARLEADLMDSSAADRPASRFGIMDVIDRWKLGFRLSRIIEIVGGARNRKLTADDAATVARLIREHVKNAA